MKKKFNMLVSFVRTRWGNRFRRRKELDDYQERKIARQLEYFRKNSPYFKEMANNREYPEEDFSIQKSIYTKLDKTGVVDNGFKMDKKFMMDNFDMLNTLGIKKEEALKVAIEGEATRDFTKKHKGVSVGLSSGTSGHRGIFITTEEEQGIWAGTILAKMLPKGKLFGHRIGFFLRADNNLYKSVNSALLKLEYFDLFKDVREHVERLNKLNPTILIGPPSLLSLLAEMKKKGELHIKPVKIISVAEILEERDKEYILENFDVETVHQVYQATEGFLGYTCEHGNMHLNEDIIRFVPEYIDERRFYPIITDFTRTTQPFINYRLNDILVENTEPCPCGRIYRRIDKIEGREDDIFKFIDRKGKVVTVFPDFIRRCLLFTENIREYQVFQNSHEFLEVAVPDITDEQKSNIREEFNKLFTLLNIDSESIEINFIEYRLDRNIKMKRICQKMKKEELI